MKQLILCNRRVAIMFFQLSDLLTWVRYCQILGMWNIQHYIIISNNRKHSQKQNCNTKSKGSSPLVNWGHWKRTALWIKKTKQNKTKLADIAICCPNTMWNFHKKNYGRFLSTSLFVKGIHVGKWRLEVGYVGIYDPNIGYPSNFENIKVCQNKISLFFSRYFTLLKRYSYNPCTCTCCFLQNYWYKYFT